EALGEALLACVPAQMHDPLVHRICVLTPIFGPIGKAERSADARQPIAARPAHHAGKSMHARATAVFPQSRVLLVVEQYRALAQLLQALEQRLVARNFEALVEERLRSSQYHRAIHIMLYLLISLVPDTHRAHRAIPRQRFDYVLIELSLSRDAIQWLQRTALCGFDDVHDVVQIRFHGARRTEAVERLHGEIAVAQPAEAI